MSKQKIFQILVCCLFVGVSCAQDSPAITSWLQNSINTGTYYMSGNSTVMDNGILYNCQKVEYSDDYVYVHASGIPAYPTGPFSDGNPSQAEDQNAIYKIPLEPIENTGVKDATTGGNIGIFINGVSLFDYRDGVGWDPTTNALCGGPGNPPCPGGPMAEADWTRDAIPAEKEGFDCSKAHPAMGNYHHHQNPSAFKLDLEVVSDICNLYDADGLYAINSDEHSPLIGFAYDGFPIYGAYGFKNQDGSGGIARIKSSYKLRNITVRNTYADGSSVDVGPDVDGVYFLGYFREDYEWIEVEEEDYLDEHNGRFCVTPEYPDGIYAYFATVDEQWNSAYPYVVGPTFYGNFEKRDVNSVDENTMIYDGIMSINQNQLSKAKINIFPNPATDLIAVQIKDLVKKDIEIRLKDINGRLIEQKNMAKGTTIAYFSTETLYNGIYVLELYDGISTFSQKITVNR